MAIGGRIAPGGIPILGPNLGAPIEWGETTVGAI